MEILCDEGSGRHTTWQNIDAELNALKKVEGKKDSVFYTTFESL